MAAVAKPSFGALRGTDINFGNFAKDTRAILQANSPRKAFKSSRVISGYIARVVIVHQSEKGVWGLDVLGTESPRTGFRRFKQFLHT